MINNNTSISIKYLVILIFIITSIVTHYGLIVAENNLKCDRYWVNALNGLIMRSSPDQNNNAITVIPYNSEICVISKKNFNRKITLKSGEEGKWVKILFYNKKGWVFNTYISKNKIGDNENLQSQLVDMSLKKQNNISQFNINKLKMIEATKYICNKEWEKTSSEKKMFIIYFDKFQQITSRTDFTAPYGDGTEGPSYKRNFIYKYDEYGKLIKSYDSEFGGVSKKYFYNNNILNKIIVNKEIVRPYEYIQKPKLSYDSIDYERSVDEYIKKNHIFNDIKYAIKTKSDSLYSHSFYFNNTNNLVLELGAGLEVHAIKYDKNNRTVEELNYDAGDGVYCYVSKHKYVNDKLIQTNGINCDKDFKNVTTYEYKKSLLLNRRTTFYKYDKNIKKWVWYSNNILYYNYTFYD